jgi:hypothetical protein
MATVCITVPVIVYFITFPLAALRRHYSSFAEPSPAGGKRKTGTAPAAIRSDVVPGLTAARRL